jgi:hypothetical protein
MTIEPTGAAADLTSVVREALAILNGLSVAELGRLHREIERARAVLDSAGQGELAARLAEGAAALRAGDTREFRRAISNVTARLGHLK